MRICDEGHCSRKKICRVYEMALNIRGEVLLEVTHCQHFSGIAGQFVKKPTAPRRSIEEINETSAKIHALQKEKTDTSPQTTAKARAGHMQFSVDDREIN